MTERDVTRVAILGASNVTFSLPWVVATLRAGFSEPLQISIAHGHGRSYGNWSQVLWRRLPGLNSAPIWDALAPQPPGYALLTDIGNDLVYGSDISEISTWVRECAARLTAMGARMVITELPMHSVRSLSRSRYLFFRTAFFPGCRLSLGEIRTRAEELNESVVQIARDFDATLLKTQADWYGLDPIHIRRRARPGAWRQIMSGWDGWGSTSGSAKPHAAMRLWRLKPRTREWFGRPQEWDESVTLGAETTVRVY